MDIKALFNGSLSEYMSEKPLQMVACLMLLVYGISVFCKCNKGTEGFSVEDENLTSRFNDIIKVRDDGKKKLIRFTCNLGTIETPDIRYLAIHQEDIPSGEDNTKGICHPRKALVLIKKDEMDSRYENYVRDMVHQMKIDAFKFNTSKPVSCDGKHCVNPEACDGIDCQRQPLINVTNEGVTTTVPMFNYKPKYFHDFQINKIGEENAYEFAASEDAPFGELAPSRAIISAYSFASDNVGFKENSQSNDLSNRNFACTLLTGSSGRLDQPQHFLEASAKPGFLTKMYIHSGTITQNPNSDDIVGAEVQTNLKLAFHFKLPVMSVGAPAIPAIPAVIGTPDIPAVPAVPAIQEVKVLGVVTTVGVPAVPAQPLIPGIPSSPGQAAVPTVPPQILKDGNGNIITAKFVLGKCINPNQDGSINVCLHNSNRGKEILFEAEVVNHLNNYYPQIDE